MFPVIRRVVVKNLRLILSTGIVVSLLSCGGGGSGIYGGFDTVLVGVAQLTPPKLESDTVVKLDDNADGICDRFLFEDDEIQITLRSEVIKDANGEDITNNPSPVYIDRYKLTFISAVNNNNCENYESCRSVFATPYEQLTSITVDPGTEIPTAITVALGSWKSTVLSQHCLTSLDNCIYNVVLEMRGREVLTGSDKTIRATFNVQFMDYPVGNSEGVTADANCTIQ